MPILSYQPNRGIHISIDLPGVRTLVTLAAIPDETLYILGRVSDKHTDLMRKCLTSRKPPYQPADAIRLGEALITAGAKYLLYLRIHEILLKRGRAIDVEQHLAVHVFERDDPEVPVCEDVVPSPKIALYFLLCFIGTRDQVAGLDARKGGRTVFQDGAFRHSSVVCGGAAAFLWKIVNCYRKLELHY